MARSSLKSISLLADTACNSPRTDEAAKWQQVKDSLHSVGQKGQVVASAHGCKIAERHIPIAGATMMEPTGVYPDQLEYKFHFPIADVTHTTYFEQPSFQTVGASTSPDKFALHIRFALSDFLAPEAATVPVDGNLGGRIRVQIQNAGGTHEIYSAENHRILSGLSQDILTPSNNIAYQVYDRAIYGQLPSAVVPAGSATYDSKLIITVSDILYGYSGTPAATDILYADNLNDPSAYIGVFGYTLRLYNDG